MVVGCVATRVVAGGTRGDLKGKLCAAGAQEIATSGQLDLGEK